MPSTVIEICKAYSPEEEIGIMDAVHKALMEAFGIPEEDRTMRLVVHEPHRFQSPVGTKHPELYTLVNIDCFAGRSLDAKRRLYQCITRNLEDLGIPADHILIVLREIPVENWGIRGGQAACDVDLGFEVSV